MQNTAVRKLNEFFKSPNYSPEFHGDKRTLLAKWKKRYLKDAKLSYQKELLEKYINGRDEFVMPSKV